jgi:hypothetical protein
LMSENYVHALDFALHLSRLSLSWWFWIFPFGRLLLCLRVITEYPALVTVITLGKGRANLMHTYAPLLDPSQTHIRLETQLQIKRCKNQHVHPAMWKFVHWLPRYASTIIYRCIMLLQLLYRWQHKSRKLWIDVIKRKKVVTHFEFVHTISKQLVYISRAHRLCYSFKLELTNNEFQDFISSPLRIITLFSIVYKEHF